MLAPKMGRSTMVHSFIIRFLAEKNRCRISMASWSTSLVDFVPRVKLQLLSTTLVQPLYVKRLRNYAEIDAEIMKI